MTFKSAFVASLLAATIATPAMAQDGGGSDVDVDLIANFRLRYETVDQAIAVDDANALTARARVGVTASTNGFQFLVEGEGTLALVDDYNDTIPSNGLEPFPVVADPDSIELNRASISYMQDGTGATVGRQRIIYDNARFVGNVGWRQNEQTFDAVRGQAALGPVKLNATYAIAQRTIFGSESPNSHFDGDFVLLNAGVDLEVVDASAFAYIIDYDTRLAFSSETYGATAKVSLPVPGLSPSLTLGLATQSDTGGNPTAYTAEWYHAELGASVAGFSLAAGYEELGSDGGVASFQTPLATLHAFNGWADVFLTTPATGLRDYYARVGRGFGIPGIGNVNAAVAYHQFDSDFGGIDYGSEWDASLGFRIGKVGVLAKYANFNSDGFATDTEKFWLQAEISF